MTAGDRIHDPADVLRIIYAMHWDIYACPCWICETARVLGCKGTGDDLDWRGEGYGFVSVDRADLDAIIASAKGRRR